MSLSYYQEHDGIFRRRTLPFLDRIFGAPKFRAHYIFHERKPRILVLSLILYPILAMIPFQFEDVVPFLAEFIEDGPFSFAFPWLLAYRDVSREPFPVRPSFIGVLL